MALQQTYSEREEKAELRLVRFKRNAQMTDREDILGKTPESTQMSENPSKAKHSI